MAYEPTKWVDHVNSGNKFRLTDNGDGTVNIDYAGEVIQQGTPMAAEKFNHMEQGIKKLDDDKVDKIEGKGLSTNDYTIAEKNKLSGIETGAQVNKVTGVKGHAESSYRTGNIDITAANIGAAAASHTHNYAGSSSPGGAATSAVKLASARTINGVSFNGTANIDLPSGRTWNCGGNVGETGGWYLFMTKAMNTAYEDFNMTLSIQDTHASAAKYGIFHVHIRQESGSKGSYNYNPAYIQFEMCEDGLTDKAYCTAVYNKAVEVCAYLCKTYNISVNNIVSHHEAGQKGYGSGHIDPDNWWSKHGYNMDKFRAEVKTKLAKPILDKTGKKKGDKDCLALKELLLIAKKLGLHKCGIDENQFFGDGTLKTVNYFLNTWGYQQSGIAGDNFVKRLKSEIDKKVK